MPFIEDDTTALTLKGASLADSLDGKKDIATILKITAGSFTDADWSYLQNLIEMTDFELTDAVTDVVVMPTNGD